MGVEDAERMLAEFVQETRAGERRWPVKARDFAAGQAILAADASTQCAIAVLAAQAEGFHWLTWDLARNLLRRRLPWRVEQLCALIDLSMVPGRHSWLELVPMLKVVATHCEGGKVPTVVRSSLERLAKRCGARQYRTADVERGLQMVARLIHGEARMPVDDQDRWAREAVQQIDGAEPELATAWRRLLGHAAESRSSRPSARWCSQAKLHLEAVGETFERWVPAWFGLFDEAAERSRIPNARNADVLRGLAWMAGLRPDAALQRALVTLAIASVRTVPNLGPRAARVANGCIWALGRIGTKEAVGHLAVLATRFKKGSVRNEVEKAMRASAAALGMDRDELDELAVPTFGLTTVGQGEFEFGDVTARLVLPDGGGGSVLQWRNAQGKPLKAPPAAVKAGSAAGLKELKAQRKDLDRLVTAVVARLDGLYLSGRRIPFDVFRARYLEHPVVGAIARRLIWSFAVAGVRVAAVPNDGGFVGIDGTPIVPSDGAEVTLWHPIEATVDEVLRWRERLAALGVVQPFKQAHREVYLLTDAERRTEVYSNRFAAHILKQHQFSALAAARGWRHKLRLMVDDFAPPTSRDLPAFGLRAEYWVEGIGENHGTDTTAAGSFLHVATDQVRFYAIDSATATAHAAGGGFQVAADDAPRRLEEIPALVLSEILRDVDLFVGVASVGNDPQWMDHGRDRPQREYWSGFAFGELSASAEIRRQVLEGLVPRLRIADRCSFADRFLVVRGDLCTYKIHLGSGNILMSPGDRYLCIVGDSGPSARGDTIHLPFEGDRLLSMILSKAILLAADGKITDVTITRQIQAR
jgi:hypothetical protein